MEHFALIRSLVAFFATKMAEGGAYSE